jgi:hypothetical protein
VKGERVKGRSVTFYFFALLGANHRLNPAGNNFDRAFRYGTFSPPGGKGITFFTNSTTGKHHR